ncbi:MAG: membrane protein insertase YidC [Ferruginibacter sp.]
MDRNTVIGFILIGALLIGMFVLNSRSRLAFEGEKKRIEDSTAAANLKNHPRDTVAARLDSLKADSLRTPKQAVAFQSGSNTEQLIQVENEVLKISFTNKGGQPKNVELKKHKKLDGSPVVLQSGDFNKLSYAINADAGSAQTADIFFAASPVVVNADKSKTITFTAADSSGKQLSHRYTIRENDYMVDLDISITGADKLLSQNTLSLLWQSEAEQIEKNYDYEKTQTHISYVKNGDYDFEYIASGDEKDFSKPVEWISVKQQFFATALSAKNTFVNAKVAWTVPKDTNTHYITRATTNAQVKLPAGNVAIVPLQFYYGPSDYNILKKYDNKMENMVPYGSGVFAFVKYINRYFLLPVFDFFQKYIASMGLVILLLTLLIRLITSPILYKSYLSGAKMKVLKPEVDALKLKYKDDQQAFSMEQMKLWKTAGVSPLGGCLPALLQIPIFMSLYYFFQSNIDLRGKSFLWANDLAAYDSIAKLPFSIPFYGDHVSLFTLFAVITSLLISIYSMSNMQDNSNPVMKYMPYIFPVLLLGVFNKLPAALTWYYTVSNTITLILQIVIQKYIIDHDKILAQISENRKKPVKKSKLQERMEAMQASQKKLQEMKTKPGNKK